MSISNPTQLVEEFKKSGEFDRLRRELLAEFQRGDHMAGFSQKIEDVVTHRLDTDKFGRFTWAQGSGYLKNELIEEIERYPYVETTVNGMNMFSDPDFQSNIRESVQRILREDRGEKLSPLERPKSSEKLLINSDSDKLNSITPSSAGIHSDTATNPTTATDREKPEEASHTPSGLKQPDSVSPPQENSPAGVVVPPSDATHAETSADRGEEEAAEREKKLDTVVGAPDIVMEDATPPEATLPTPDGTK